MVLFPKRLAEHRRDNSGRIGRSLFQLRAVTIELAPKPLGKISAPFFGQATVGLPEEATHAYREKFTEPERAAFLKQFDDAPDRFGG